VPFFAARLGADFALGELQGGDVPLLVEVAEFRAWTVDLDLVLTPNHSGRADAPIGALDPMVFAGLGLRSAVDLQGTLGTLPTAGYGAGLSFWLHRNIRIEVEARRWSVLTDRDALAESFEPDGWSFRAGAAFHIGPRFLGEAPPEVPVRVDTVWLRPEAGEEPADTGGADPGAPWRDIDVDEARREILEEAEGHLGTPYVWGGAEPVPGFDCSGFVQYVFASQGIELPRPSRVMAQVGAEMPAVPDSLLPGDVMFFSRTGSPNNITHVGIYAGGGTMLHATGSGGGVAFDNLTTPRGQWFADRLVAAARVIGVPVMATRAAPIPITPETWDPAWDGAPPKEGVEPPQGVDPGG
jgi:hypothetical protein